MKKYKQIFKKTLQSGGECRILKFLEIRLKTIFFIDEIWLNLIQELFSIQVQIYIPEVSQWAKKCAMLLGRKKLATDIYIIYCIANFLPFLILC